MGDLPLTLAVLFVIFFLPALLAYSSWDYNRWRARVHQRPLSLPVSWQASNEIRGQAYFLDQLGLIPAYAVVGEREWQELLGDPFTKVHPSGRWLTLHGLRVFEDHHSRSSLRVQHFLEESGHYSIPVERMVIQVEYPGRPGTTLVS